MKTSIKGLHRVIQESSPPKDGNQQHTNHIKSTLFTYNFSPCQTQQHSCLKINQDFKVDQASNQSQEQKDKLNQEQKWMIQQEFMKVNSQRTNQLDSQERSTLREETIPNYSMEENSKQNIEEQTKQYYVQSKIQIDGYKQQAQTRHPHSHRLYKQSDAQQQRNNLIARQFQSRINHTDTQMNHNQIQLNNLNNQLKKKAISMRTLVLIQAPNRNKSSNISMISNQSTHSFYNNNQITPDNLQKSQNQHTYSKSLLAQQSYHKNNNFQLDKDRFNTQNDTIIIDSRRVSHNSNQMIAPQSEHQASPLSVDSNNYSSYQKDWIQYKVNENSPSLFTEPNKEVNGNINNPFSNSMISSTINSLQIGKQFPLDKQDHQELNPANQQLIDFGKCQNEIYIEENNPQVNLEANQAFIKSKDIQVSTNLQEYQECSQVRQELNPPSENIQVNLQCQNQINSEQNSIIMLQKDLDQNINYNKQQKQFLNDKTEINSNKKKFVLPLSLLNSPINSNEYYQETKSSCFSKIQLTSQSSRVETPLNIKQVYPSQNLFKQQYDNKKQKLQRPQTSITYRSPHQQFNNRFVGLQQDQQQIPIHPQEPYQIELLKLKKYNMSISSQKSSQANTPITQQHKQEAQILSKSSSIFMYIDKKCEETQLNSLEERVKQIYKPEELILQEYINFIQKTRQKSQHQLIANQQKIQKSDESQMKYSQIHSQQETPNKINQKYSQTIDFSHQSGIQMLALQKKQRPFSSQQRVNINLDYSQNTQGKGQITRKLKKYACKFSAVSQQFQKLKQNTFQSYHQ